MKYFRVKIEKSMKRLRVAQHVASRGENAPHFKAVQGTAGKCTAFVQWNENLFVSGSSICPSPNYFLKNSIKSHRGDLHFLLINFLEKYFKIQ
jgi:hypothetical protein